ncbi:MAG TPA: ABC transporter ATP-binding protein [Acidimicrobiales bacterium]|nr:ABC transporter ATP-binding protein [Acidimicrobiales bacterium]
MAGAAADLKERVPVLRTLVPELPRASRPLTVAAAACILVGAILPVGFAIASGVAVGAVPGAVAGGLASDQGRRLITAVVAVSLLFAVSQALHPIQDFVINAIQRRMRARTYRRSLAATLRPATIAHLESPALLDKVAAATIISPAGPGAAVRALLHLTRTRIAAVATLLLVARFRWWLALLLAATEIGFGWTWARIYNRLVAFRVLHLPGLRRAVYLRGLAMKPDAAKETRTFGLADWVVDRFRAAWLGAMAEVWQSRRGNFLKVSAVTAPVVAAQVLAYWLVGRAAISGEIGLGAAVTYAQAVMASAQLCFAGGDLTLDEGAAITRATAELEHTVSTDPRLQLPGAAPASGLPRHEVRFEDVSFRYDGNDAPVLDHLDLVVPAGQSLAVVGDNGAGKTTLVKLLARLYDPVSGRIRVDDVPLTDIDPVDWQGRVAAVFQDFVRYPWTLRDNITLGRPGADPAKAARRAGVLDLVEAHGWDAILSREFDGGVELSGGEWQRIVLARALYAAEARAGGILILDEPTAHLDARAEAGFYDSFFDVTAGCTTIVISHRFSTVRRAQRIVVLDGGRVAESGTHDDLLAAGGRYARMFQLQASRFVSDG